MHKGQGIATATLFLLVAIAFFAGSYLAPSFARMYLIIASVIPFAFFIGMLFKR